MEGNFTVRVGRRIGGLSVVFGGGRFEGRFGRRTERIQFRQPGHGL